jgi:hypothetical protein
MSTHVVASPYKTEHFLHNIWVIKFGKGSLFNMSVHVLCKINPYIICTHGRKLLTHLHPPIFIPKQFHLDVYTKSIKKWSSSSPIVSWIAPSSHWADPDIPWSGAWRWSYPDDTWPSVWSPRGEKCGPCGRWHTRSIDSTIETRHQISMANLWKYWPSNLWRFLIQTLGTQMMRNEWIRLLWMCIDLPII